MVTRLFYNGSSKRWAYTLNGVEIHLHAGDCICAYLPESNSIFCTVRNWQHVYIEYSWVESSWYIVTLEGIPVLEELNGLEIRIA